MDGLLRRNAEDYAASILNAMPVLVLQGARQVGKSTFAQMLATSRPSRLFTLDDEQTRAAAQEDPRGFVDQSPETLVVIDEIQRLPELTLAIKAAVDRHRRPGRFILTGSSDLLRVKRAQDSLAGRAATVELYGLSQGEIGKRTDDFASHMRATADLGNHASFNTQLSRRDYVQLVAAGSYPSARALSGRLRNTWFDSYLERIIQRDARELRQVIQTPRLASLMRLIAANQSGELVKARLAGDAGLPASSITNYLDVLQTLFLITSLSPWTPNLTKREIGRPKTHVTDSGLAARLSRVTEGQLASIENADHLGGLLEGFVVSEMLRQQTWSEQEFHLFHFRDRTGIEVDLIVEFSDGRVFGVEVKSSSSFNAGQFKGLKFLREKLGQRFIGGVVLNTGTEGYRFADKLWGLPIAALWEYPAQ